MKASVEPYKVIEARNCVSTRSVGNYNWAKWAAVATALQISVGGDDQIRYDVSEKKINHSDFFVSLSGTVVSQWNEYFRSDLAVTTLGNDNDDVRIENILISAKPRKEFKIKSQSIKIDRSYPKIFLD